MSSPFRKQSTGSVLWEVLAPYVRWPLYSPLRLGAVILLAFLTFTACSKLNGPTPAAAPTQTVTTTATVTVSSISTATTTSSAPAPVQETAPVAAPTIHTAATPTPTVRPHALTPRPIANTSVAVAEAFVTAWARRGAAATTWRTGVAAYTTPAFAKALASTDPNRIPATKRTSAGVVKAHRGPTDTVQVATDGGPVLVTVTRAGTAWKVSDIEPVSTAPAASTPAMTPLAAAPSTTTPAPAKG